MNTNTKVPTENLIQKSLSQYLDEKEGRSYRFLEMRTGVSRSYIQRMAQGEIPAEKMDILKLCKILKVVVGNAEAKKVIFSDELLKERYLDFFELSEKLAENRTFSDGLQFAMKDTETLIVFTLAANDVGTTSQQIKDILGEPGLIALDQLLKKEVLVEKKDRIILSERTLEEQENQMFTVTHEDCKHLVQKSTKFYHPHKKGRNHISYTSESVSKEFLLQLRDKMTRVAMWMDEALKKEENKGENPFFCGMVMDTFMENLKEDGGKR